MPRLPQLIVRKLFRPAESALTLNLINEMDLLRLMLIRTLNALEQEPIDASPEDILQAAYDLGTKSQMRGTGAFAGLRYPAPPRLPDFLDLQE